MACNECTLFVNISSCVWITGHIYWQTEHALQIGKFFKLSYLRHHHLNISLQRLQHLNVRSRFTTRVSGHRKDGAVLIVEYRINHSSPITLSLYLFLYHCSRPTLSIPLHHTIDFVLLALIYRPLGHCGKKGTCVRTKLLIDLRRPTKRSEYGTEQKKNTDRN